MLSSFLDIVNHKGGSWCPNLSFRLFNSGSPYNVPAGSSTDLSAVVAHYERRNKEMEEARLARMKDGKVLSVYD